jgi:methyl-accepting chemotaxis protein
VEAARAGEAGLGFAVVADEVRSLAQRCAGAARETADKISASTEKSEQGVRISEKMAVNLAAIVDKTRQLDERIAEIAQSSHEQSEGIGQLNSAVASMDKITQDNAALAQQSAAASEELKAQAEQVRLGVAELMRMASEGGSADAPEKTKTTPSHDRVVTPRLNRPRSNGNGSNGTNTFHGSHATKSAIVTPKNSNSSESNGHHESNGANAGSASNGNGSHVVSDLAIARGSSDDLSFEDHR